MALLYPWRTADNAEEVAEAQALVDEMSVAHHSIIAGEAGIDDFMITSSGFEGVQTQTSSGISALGLIGPSGDSCLLMHWTAPEEAQVGRLPPEWVCSPDSIASIPLTAHGGYVAGTGPPFDVTAMIKEEWTPLWFAISFVVLAGIGIKAGFDLFLIFVRPDQAFSKPVE